MLPEEIKLEMVVAWFIAPVKPSAHFGKNSRCSVVPLSFEYRYLKGTDLSLYIVRITPCLLGSLHAHGVEASKLGI